MSALSRHVESPEASEDDEDDEDDDDDTNEDALNSGNNSSSRCARTSSSSFHSAPSESADAPLCNCSISCDSVVDDADDEDDDAEDSSLGDCCARARTLRTRPSFFSMNASSEADAMPVDDTLLEAWSLLFAVAAADTDTPVFDSDFWGRETAF